MANIFNLDSIRSDKPGYQENIFSYFSTKAYVVGTIDIFTEID